MKTSIHTTVFLLKHMRLNFDGQLLVDLPKFCVEEISLSIPQEQSFIVWLTLRPIDETLKVILGPV
jgi:hypothetical protein